MPLLQVITQSFPPEHPALRLPSAWDLCMIVGTYTVFWLVKHILWRPLTSPLRKLQCPPGGEGIMGHWPDMLEWVTGLDKSLPPPPHLHCDRERYHSPVV